MTESRNHYNIHIYFCRIVGGTGAPLTFLSFSVLLSPLPLRLPVLLRRINDPSKSSSWI